MTASVQMLRPNSDPQADTNVSHGVRGGGGAHTRKQQATQQTQSDPSTPKQSARAANAGVTSASAGDSPSPQATRDDKSSFHSILNHYYSSDSSGNSDSDSGDSSDAKGQQDSSQDSNNTAVAPVDAGTARKDIAPLTLTFAFPANITLPTVPSQAQTQAPSTTTAEAQTSTSQSAIAAVEVDLEEALPATTAASNPTIEEANAPNVQRGDLAFAAKLNLNTNDNGKAEAQANNASSGNSAGNSQDGGTDAKSRNVAAAAQQTQVAAKPAASSQPAETDAPVDKTRAIAFADAAPKPAAATMLAQEPASPSPMTANSKPVESAPQTNASEVARIEQAMNVPAPAASSHDITVRIADAGEHGADIRFVEHAGEVRVSVKTADPEMAQTLRGGLNDFANRMEQTGIRTEVWRPGADANSSQNAQDQFDQKGRQQNRERDSQQGSPQDNANSSKPRWVEELETSLARSN